MKASQIGSLVVSYTHVIIFITHVYTVTISIQTDTYKELANTI